MHDFNLAGHFRSLILYEAEAPSTLECWRFGWGTCCARDRCVCGYRKEVLEQLQDDESDPTQTQRAAFAPACSSSWVFASSSSSISAPDHSGGASEKETWASRGTTVVAWPSDRCRRTPSSGALTALPPLMSVGHPRPYSSLSSEKSVFFL